MVMATVTARLFLALCLLCWGAAPAAAGAQVVLEAPASVARGDAFLALAASDAPAEQFTFQWLGKVHTVRAALIEGRWQAVVLLPVPLEAGESGLALSVSAGRKGAPDAGRAVRQLRFYDKDRPVQKLTVDKKYVDPPAAQMERIKADRETVRKTLAQHLPERLWTLPFDRPVPGEASSLFGLKRVFNGQPRGLHRGLDLRGAQGAPIVACADGQVALTGNLYFSGNVVYINHGEGVFTAYLHLSETLTQTGEHVRKGQVIGRVGATGRATGPHLHLSLVAQGVSVDPQPFIAPQPATTEK